MNPRFLQPPWLITIGVLLFLILLLVAGELWFLSSKDHKADVNSLNSEQFGEALHRSGIETQKGPSHN